MNTTVGILYTGASWYNIPGMHHGMSGLCELGVSGLVYTSRGQAMTKALQQLAQ